MKTDQDYIREAVRLADGFSVAGVAGLFLHMDVTDEEFPYHIQTSLDSPAKFFLAALAAQLTEQVDAVEDWTITSFDSSAVVVQLYGGGEDSSHGPDRNMNTIKVVVDSKVLTK